MKPNLASIIVLTGLLMAPLVAKAGLIVSTLGNASSGFNDGDQPTTASVGAAQGGQVAPFDTGYGTDGLFGGNFDQLWVHSFSAIAEPILSASLEFGIVDHDSSATGSQLGLFTVDGADLTSDLDTLFEAGGGSLDLEYNVYTIDLASLLANLADGSLAVSLTLAGPGLVTPLFPLPGPNPPAETTTNGANLIFSRLSIETDDGVAPVNSPSTLPLAILGLWLLFRRRGRHNRAVSKIHFDQ